MSDKPPSAWHLERAMSIAMQALAAAHNDAPEHDTDAEALLAVLRDAGADVHNLVLRLCLSINEDELSAEACKAREAEVATRRKRFDRYAEAKREAVLGIIQALPEIFRSGKFKDALATATVKVGQPGVVVTNEAAIPEAYVRVKREPDKSLIRADLLQGVVMDGAELRNPKPYLQLKVT